MSTPLRKILSRYDSQLEHKYPGFRYVSLWLLFALLMVIFPLIEGTFGAMVFTALFSLILLNSLLTANGSRGVRITIVVLLLIALSTRWSFLVVGGQILDGLSFLFSTLTLALASVVLFVNLFKAERVCTATIWQAVSIYLLLGMAWACLYAMINVLTPGSFQDSSLPSNTMGLPTFIYFSFVSLATLGYGDIVPITQLARGLVIIEVLMGVLYMAILISKLVGAWRPREDRTK